MLTTLSRSGLRVTTPMCDQYRALPDQRAGLRCFDLCVQFVASYQDGLVLASVALLRADIANAAV